MKKLIALFSFLTPSFFLIAQVAINTSGTSGDASAMLDVSGTKGMLIPRMAISSRNIISSPATGLLIYQTDATPGFYYNRGTPTSPSWVRIGEEKPGASNKRTFFTSSGSFTVPANITRIYFEACSAGGGSGGRYYNGADYKWGGGGGGGGLVKGYIDVTPGQTINVAIGNGGTNGTSGSGGTAATDGSNGGNTIVDIGGTAAFNITGGQPGMAGNSSSAGTAGSAGALLTFNSTNCTILESWTGLGGFSGIATPGSSNDYSGIGGTVGRVGDFNYLFPFVQFAEPYSSSSFIYYPSYFYGKGAGRGSVSSGGYVYFTW